MMQAIRTGPTVRWEEASKTPTGRTFSERADIPILEKHGRCRHLLRVVPDVTERKRAEAALLESEEKFSKAFRSCPDAVALSELETGRYIDINEGYERLFGLSREEVIGRTSLELGVYQDPQDRRRVVEELRAHGLVRDVELRCLNRHRQPRICLYGGGLIELSGRPFIVSVIHDITHRVQAEE